MPAVSLGRLNVTTAEAKALLLEDKSAVWAHGNVGVTLQPN